MSLPGTSPKRVPFKELRSKNLVSRRLQFEQLEKREVLSAAAWTVFSYFDMNGDSRLNALDSLQVANASNMPEARWDIKFDLNRDRSVDQYDFDAIVTAVLTAKKYKLPGDMRSEGEYGGPPEPSWDLPELDAVNYTSFDISADPYTRDMAGLKTFPTQNPHSGAGVGGRSSYNRYFQWEDANRDGVIDHLLDEASLPVAIVANTKANVRSRLWAADPSKNYPPLVWARAYNPVTPLNINVSSQPAVLVGFEPADLHYHFDYLATSNFYDKVEHFTSVSIRFDVDLVGGAADWTQVGQSNNHVYVTLDSPYAAPIDNNGNLMPYYHTVLHIGSHYGAGETTADGLISKVWDYIKGLQVKNQDVTQFNGLYEVKDFDAPLYYYRFSQDAGCTAATTAELLVDQLHQINSSESQIVQCGQCGAFARLFQAVLSTQGVKTPAIANPPGQPILPPLAPLEKLTDATQSHITVRPFAEGENAIFIKQQNGTAGLQPGDQVTNPTPGNQIDGQNESDPKASVFKNHQFVGLVVGGVRRWFDPSYGVEYVGPTTILRVADWETKAVAGTGQYNFDLKLGNFFIDEPFVNTTQASLQSYREIPPENSP